MQINYDAKTDLLYLRLDPRPQTVVNKRVSDEIVLDIGEDDRIIGIGILEAPQHLNLEALLPIRYSIPTVPKLAVRENPDSQA